MPSRDAAFVARMLLLADALRHQGVSTTEFAPPLYRLLWRLGLRPRPPLYQSLRSFLLTTALPCGALCGFFWGWGMQLGLTIALRLDTSLATLPVDARHRLVTLIWWGAAVFGTAMAIAATARWRRRVRELRLPPIVAGFGAP